MRLIEGFRRVEAFIQVVDGAYNEEALRKRG
jgi:hypothetical protein